MNISSVASATMVLGPDGNPIIQDNQMLLQMEDGSIAFYPVVQEPNTNEELNSNTVQDQPNTDTIQDQPNIDNIHEEPNSDTMEEVIRNKENSKSQNQKSRKKPQGWSRDEILKLIHSYEEHIPSFTSTTTRNEKVWALVANSFRGKNTEQIKNKWKYLKSKYIEIKDNMGDHDTGGRRKKFEYYEDFDRLFGRDPNVEPVAIGSSIRGKKNIEEAVGAYKRNSLTIESETDIFSDEESVESSSNERPAKRKRTFKKKSSDELVNMLKERENASEKRHKDRMERQDTALDLLKNIANSFERFVGKPT